MPYPFEDYLFLSSILGLFWLRHVGVINISKTLGISELTGVTKSQSGPAFQNGHLGNSRVKKSRNWKYSGSRSTSCYNSYSFGSPI